LKALNCLKIIVLLLPGFGLILFFLGMILYVALFQSFGFFNLSGEDNFTIQYWQKLFNKKVFYRSINYSLYVGIISSIISVVLAYPIALWLRKPFYGSILINSILKAPLLVHGLVAAFLYVNLVAYHGIINQIFIAIGAWDEPIRMQNDKNAIGVLILQVWKNLPFALLILLGSIQSIGDDIVDAARDLGANSFERLKKIIAPLTISSMQAALIIIFIGALADFSFQSIAGPTNKYSLSQLMLYYKNNGRWHEAAGVGVTIMIISFIGAIFISYLTRFIFFRVQNK
jgi:putative spermidine/putrescine transport system permease protein